MKAKQSKKQSYSQLLELEAVRSSCSSSSCWRYLTYVETKAKRHQALHNAVTPHPAPDSVQSSFSLSSIFARNHASPPTHAPTGVSTHPWQFFGDIASVIIDIEDSIVRQCETKVLEHADLLIELGHYFAELDCILSLADAALDQNYVRPQVVTDNVIFVKVCVNLRRNPSPPPGLSHTYVGTGAASGNFLKK